MARDVATLGVALDAKGIKSGLRDLGTRFDRMEKNAKKSARGASRGFKGMERAISAAKGALLALTAGLSIRAFTSLINNTTKMQEAAGLMSTRLGIATEKLTAFHFAIRFAGIRAAEFDMALQRMARRVAEAAQGMGEAKTAIQELGLDAAKLAQLPVDKQMNAIADALLKVENQSDRVRLAFKLFDSGGVKLLQTLDEAGTAGSGSVRVGFTVAVGFAVAVEFLGRHEPILTTEPVRLQQLPLHPPSQLPQPTKRRAKMTPPS